MNKSGHGSWVQKHSQFHLYAESRCQNTFISTFGGAELLMLLYSFLYCMDPAHLSLLLVDSEIERGPPRWQNIHQNSTGQAEQSNLGFELLVFGADDCTGDL